MKRINIASLLIAVILFVTGCEKERIMFDTALKVVGFSSATLTLPENVPAGGKIKIYFGAPAGTEAAQISLTIDTVGHKNPAVEGEDFTISTKQVSVPLGTVEVTIIPIDDDVFTGDKTFNVKLVTTDPSYTVAAQNSVLVTISDDEHPLKSWIGTYDVAAVSYGNPGPWDEDWVVITSPVAGDITKLQLVGIGSGTNVVIATINSVAKTITIDPGQNAGNAYGYGNTLVYWGFDDLSAFDADKKLTGTIDDDGTIHIDNWAMILPAYGNYIWDVFNTTWTKR